MLSNRVGALLVFLDPGLVQRFETLGRMPEHVLGHAFWAHFFSWHLDVRINELAGDAAGALDPQEFWRAWAAGAATTVDTFSRAGISGNTSKNAALRITRRVVHSGGRPRSAIVSRAWWSRAAKGFG
jgi:hypothetical protein